MLMLVVLVAFATDRGACLTVLCVDPEVPLRQCLRMLHFSCNCNRQYAPSSGQLACQRLETGGEHVV